MTERTRVETTASTITASRLLIVDEIARQGSLSPQTTPRMVDLIDRFCRFAARGHGLTTLSDVATSHVADFITAPSERGRASTGTMHLRRSAVRLLFRVARQLDLATHDPTLDIALPPRSSLQTRPLTDDEVALCRSSSLQSLTSTRPSAAWALAETTARTAELPHLRASDVDLDEALVWLHGSTKAEPRWGRLSDWGVAQVERRLRQLTNSCDPDPLLIYKGRGSDESRQASSCIAIADTLRRAGLANEPDVRPHSVTAWAGRQIFDESGRIDEVARRLGTRSLDTAARLICWDWANEDEEQ